MTDQDNSPLGDIAGKPFKDDGGPAFPHIDPIIEGHGQCYEGLTKRDWFAGKALQGLIKTCVRKDGCALGLDHEEISQDAYKYADAMLNARNKT